MRINLVPMDAYITVPEMAIRNNGVSHSLSEPDARSHVREMTTINRQTKNQSCYNSNGRERCSNDPESRDKDPHLRVFYLLSVWIGRICSAFVCADESEAYAIGTIHDDR